MNGGNTSVWHSVYQAIPVICVIYAGGWLVYKIIKAPPVGERPTTPPPPRPPGPAIATLISALSSILDGAKKLSAMVLIAVGATTVLVFQLGLIFLAIFLIVWAVKTSLDILR